MENDKMQGMIKFELKRSFKNRLFLISLLISLALVTWYSIERIPYCVQLNSEFLNDENLMGFLKFHIQTGLAVIISIFSKTFFIWLFQFSPLCHLVVPFMMI